MCRNDGSKNLLFIIHKHMSMSYMEVTGVSKKKKASREYSGSAEGWGPSGLITYKQRNKNNQRSMTSNPGVLQKLRLLKGYGLSSIVPKTVLPEQSKHECSGGIGEGGIHNSQQDVSCYC